METAEWTADDVMHHPQPLFPTYSGKVQTVAAAEKPKAEEKKPEAEEDKPEAEEHKSEAEEKKSVKKPPPSVYCKRE